MLSENGSSFRSGCSRCNPDGLIILCIDPIWQRSSAVRTRCFEICCPSMSGISFRSFLGLRTIKE
jgi:hypothetical protein